MELQPMELVGGAETLPAVAGWTLETDVHGVKVLTNGGSDGKMCDVLVPGYGVPSASRPNDLND